MLHPDRRRRATEQHAVDPQRRTSDFDPFLFELARRLLPGDTQCDVRTLGSLTRTLAPQTRAAMVTVLAGGAII